MIQRMGDLLIKSTPESKTETTKLSTKYKWTSANTTNEQGEKYNAIVTTTSVA